MNLCPLFHFRSVDNVTRLNYVKWTSGRIDGRTECYCVRRPLSDDAAWWRPCFCCWHNLYVAATASMVSSYCQRLGGCEWWRRCWVHCFFDEKTFRASSQTNISLSIEDIIQNLEPRSQKIEDKDDTHESRQLFLFDFGFTFNISAFGWTLLVLSVLFCGRPTQPRLSPQSDWPLSLTWVILHGALLELLVALL